MVRSRVSSEGHSFDDDAASRQILLRGRVGTLLVALASTVGFLAALQSDRRIIVLACWLATWIAIAPLMWWLHHQTARYLGDRFRFERLAEQDHLTGVSNRRALFRRLEHDDGLARGTGILVVDLDGFKAVNDEHGHHAGDLVLEDIASRIARVLRGRPAILGRLGGDEFMIVTEDAVATEDLDRIAARVVEVCRPPVMINDAPLSVTASVGSALVEERDPDVAVRRADRNMYEAKRAGGDRWVRA